MNAAQNTSGQQTNRATNQRAAIKQPISIPQAPVTKPGGKVLEGVYLGFSPCDYIAGQQNKTCTDIVNQKLVTQKENKAAKKRPTQVTVTVSNDGLLFVFGASEAARFYVPVKDIASMSLCPKGKSGVLKIAAVLCRSSEKRVGVKGGPRRQDMICHVWRPKTSADLWDFYANFESMLKNRGVNDPYLSAALDTAPDRRASLGKEQPVRKSVLDHFEKNGIDRLEALMDQISATDNKVSTPTAKKYMPKIYVKPCEDEADSDIELDLSDDDDNEEAGDSSSEIASSDASGSFDEELNLSKVVTLGVTEDAQC